MRVTFPLKSGDFIRLKKYYKDNPNDEGTETVTFSVSTAINGRESAYKPEKSDAE